MQFTRNIILKSLIINFKNVHIFIALIRNIHCSESTEANITEKDINEVYNVDFSGNFGEENHSSDVYLANRKTDGKQVIVKQPYEEEIDEFSVKHEYEVLKNLEHECVVKIIDKIYKNPGKHYPLKFDYYLVFEKVEGQTFLEYIEDNKKTRYYSPEKEEEFIKYFRNILIGLEYIHANNIVHCDLKYADIMFNKGDVKILDFGQAGNSNYKMKFSRFDDEEGEDCGHYAPEIQDGKEYGTKADMYSIGYLFNEIYREFVGQRSGYYLPLEDLIQKCMKTNPAERISSKEALRHQLFDTILPNAYGFSQLKKFTTVKENYKLEKNRNSIFISTEATKIRIEEINLPETPTLGLQKKTLSEFKFFVNNKELDIHSVLNKYIDIIKVAFDEIKELSLIKDCLRERMNDHENTSVITE